MSERAEKPTEFTFQMTILGKVQAASKEHAVAMVATAFSVPLTMVDAIERVNLNVDEASSILKPPAGFNPKVLK